MVEIRMNSNTAIFFIIFFLLIFIGGIVYSMKNDGKNIEAYIMPKLNALDLTIIRDVEIDSPSIIHIVQSFDEFYNLLLYHNVTTLYLEKSIPDPNQYIYFFSDDLQIAWKWTVSSFLHQK